MKRVAALVLAASMVLGSAFTSMAASWQQNATGWWWQNDDGSWPANTWQWLGFFRKYPFLVEYSELYGKI